MSENSVFFVGNLTKDPELKFVNNGKAVVNFSVAVNKYMGKDKEAEVSYFECTAWDDLAKNFAESCTKGTRVFVAGAIQQDRFEVEGQKRSAVNITASALGPDLRFNKVSIQRDQYTSTESVQGF